MEKTTSVELTGSSMFLSGSATCFANPTIPLHGDEMETKGGSPPARTHSHGSAAAWGGGMSTRQEEDCSGLGGGGDVDKRIRLSLVVGRWSSLLAYKKNYSDGDAYGGHLSPCAEKSLSIFFSAC